MGQAERFAVSNKSKLDLLDRSSVQDNFLPLNSYLVVFNFFHPTVTAADIATDCRLDALVIALGTARAALSASAHSDATISTPADLALSVRRNALSVIHAGFVDGGFHFFLGERGLTCRGGVHDSDRCVDWLRVTMLLAHIQGLPSGRAAGVRRSVTRAGAGLSCALARTRTHICRQKISAAQRAYRSTSRKSFGIVS